MRLHALNTIIGYSCPKPKFQHMQCPQIRTMEVPLPSMDRAKPRTRAHVCNCLLLLCTVEDLGEEHTSRLSEFDFQSSSLFLERHETLHDINKQIAREL